MTAKGGANISKQALSDDAFLREFTALGASGMGRKYGYREAAIFRRRRRIEKREGLKVTPPTRGGHVQQLDKHPAAISLGIQDGFVLIGSDSHYYPGTTSTAHEAFLEFAREFKPKIIIKNGDEMDFPTISRFAHGWVDHRSI